MKTLEEALAESKDKGIVIYFANPVNTYNKPIEQKILALLKVNFTPATIINPNSAEHHVQYKKQGMSYFEDLVSKSNILVALPFSDGSVGAGIGREMHYALTRGLDTYYLEPTTFTFRKVAAISELRILSVESTRERLRTILEEYP